MKKKIYSTIIILTWLLGVNATATIQGVTSSLLAIKKTVDKTVKQSTDLFTANNRTYMSNIVNVNNNNVFLQQLDIYRDYKIVMQFVATSPTHVVLGGLNSKMSNALLNKKIIILPIFGTQPKEGGGQEAIISSWSCYTNADEGVEMFMGDNSSSLVGYLSFISNKNNRINSPYLSSCLYISSSELESLSLNLLDIPS